MGGASADDALVCPECGKRVEGERGLRKTRRRWTVAALALPLAAGAYLAPRTPAIRERGLWAAAPTTVLILMTPKEDVSEWFYSGRESEHIRELMARQWDISGSQARLLAKRLESHDHSHVVRVYDGSELVGTSGAPETAPSRLRSTTLIVHIVVDAATYHRWPPSLQLRDRIFGDRWIVAAEPRLQADCAALFEFLQRDPRGCPVIDLTSIRRAATIVRARDLDGAEPGSGIIHQLDLGENWWLFVGDPGAVAELADGLRRR
jgi:hypothetical protein